MKIVQFTDPHIGGVDQDTHGVDTRSNFIRTLEAIRNEKADSLVLTGDLCFKEPRREVYEWIKDKFEEYDVHPLIIPGNHDSTELLCDVFGLESIDGELYFREQWGDDSVFFLDSSKGIMSNSQWEWLQKNVDRDKRLIIFTHYPPIKCFVPYMDGKHNFKESARFLDLISGVQQDVQLFCGHYHVAKTVSADKLHVHITPSGFFQIRDDMEDFGIDHYRVGYRVIRLEEGVLAHGVRYID